MCTGTFVTAHTSEGNDINDLGEMLGASDCPCGQYHAVYKSPLSAKNVGYYDLGVLGKRRLLSNPNNLDDCHPWTVW